MRFLSLIGFLGLLAACGGNEASGAGGSAGSGGAGGAGGAGGGGSGAITYEFETIGTRSAKIDTTTYEATLVAAHRSDGGTSYLMVIPAAKTPAPVIVDMAPYTGIDWTGEEVDTRHATENAGPFSFYPDTDAPLDPPSTENCAYGFVPAETQIQGEAFHLLNGHSVIVAFGRFYAGGDLTDDAADAAAPFHYIAAHAADFDAERIGVHGNSWGGFMALAGIGRRPAGQSIRAVTAANPPTDFVDFYDYWKTTLPAVYPYKNELGFFEGYRRRIEVATGGPPAENEAAFEPWRRDALCAGLDGDVMIPQDDWDTLVPVEQTESFLATCSDKARGLFWRRRTPVDYATIHLAHGALEQEPGFPSSRTLGFLHLHRALANESDVVLAYYEDAALRVFFQTVHDAQVDGKDITYATPALADLLDPRVTAYDMGTMQVKAGPELASTIVSDLWGTPVTPADLAKGFPAP
ncbi:CocE/NonD family hydrolase [Polyangium sp. y55x31]|uniref:alpha/beta hydrolase family protein n=1 Tax=Polyangium sp. y55x31 TaxID=3042688 RepID=UPI002482BAFA|nr:CocE/NonD family hydrolase [Polyangium sp. y55x31]MDI1478838.1 prolyl oligopeptidase family serine peptidase [Polyangium sp. y55x31]